MPVTLYEIVWGSLKLFDNPYSVVLMTVFNQIAAILDTSYELNAYTYGYKS